jgi:hypothetical protein
LSLFLIKHHAVKTYWGVEVFLTSALISGEWSASRPGRFDAGRKTPVLLGRIFGPKREEVMEGWRNLHRPNEELHKLYSSPGIIKVIKPRTGR